MTAYTKQVYQAIAEDVARDQIKDMRMAETAREPFWHVRNKTLAQRQAAAHSLVTRERLFNLIDNVSLNQE